MRDGKDSNQRGEGNQREYLSEVFNFSCVLRGDVKYLEKIKEHIITEYVNTGLIKLIKPTYDKKEIYLLTNEENLDAVVRESEAVMQSLLTSGILEESDGELKKTEEGRNLLKVLRECEVNSEDANITLT